MIPHALRRRLGDLADLPDLAQEVYLRLLRVEQPDLVRDPGAYVYRVALNVAEEWRLRAAQTMDHEATVDELESDDEPVAAAVSGERSRTMRRALEKLPVATRTAMLLHVYRDMTYEHVASHASIDQEARADRFHTPTPAYLDFIVGAYAYTNDTRWQYDVYDYTPFSAHPERTWPRFVDVDARARKLGFADCADYVDNWYTTYGGWFPTWEVTCPDTDDHKVWLSFFNLAGSDTLAAFANVEYRLNDNWRFAGGIRWTEDDKSLVVRGHYLLDTTLWAPPQAGLPLSLDMTALWAGDNRAPRAWNATIGHVSAEYTPGDRNVMYYGRISTGYRAGGFEGAEITLQEYFDEETLVNYEAGIKGLFLDDRLQLMASGCST